MFRERVKKAEVFKSLVANLLITSFADEGDEGNGGDNGGDNGGSLRVNYEDLIKKARQEEKSKLYPEIKKYKKLFEDMTEQNNNNLLKIGTLEKKIEELEAKQSDSASNEEVESLKSKITTLENENSELKNKQSEAPNEEEIRNNIRAELEAEFNVKLYRTEKLASDEVKKSVLPMFFDSITGTTNEEIDSSIEKAVEMTKQAKEQLGIKDTDDGDGDNNEGNGDGNHKDEGDGGNKRPPKASSTAVSIGKRKYTVEDIQGLDPASDEFKELRKQLGLK